MDSRVRTVVPTSVRERGGALFDGALALRAYVDLNFSRTAAALPPGDLYVLHSYLQFPAVERVRRRHGTPFVYDAHDYYPSITQGARPEDRVDEWIRRAVEPLCIRRATETMTVSAGVADLYRERYGRRPAIVRNCHDQRLDAQIETGVRDRVGLSGDDFLIVVVGNAKPGQGLDVVLDAVARLGARAHIACVGRGYEAEAANARKHGLDGRVHFFEPVPPTQVTAFIHSADLAAVLYHAADPNYVNSLPNRFFHPLAAGLPILYPSLPEIRRLADHHGLGVMVDTRDAASIASAITDLLENPAHLEALRGNVARARSVLNWEHEERLLGRLMSSAIAQGA